MPVPAELGRIGRHDDQVADTGSDVAMAARTHVRLERFVRLDAPHREVTEAAVPQPGAPRAESPPPQPRTVHRTSATATAIAAMTNTRSPRWRTNRRYGLYPTVDHYGGLGPCAGG